MQNVITTTTDRDFVDVTVKPSKLGKALVGVALAAAATLTTTFHHPFYDITQSAFVEAVDLKPGDQVQTTDGGTATVTDVHAYHQQATTYDPTVNGLHTYYVLAGNTAILVHNCGDGEESEPYDVTVRWQEGMPKSQFSLKAAELQGLSDNGALFKAPNPVARDTSVTNKYKADLIRRVYDQFGDANPDFAPHLDQGSFAR